MLLVEISFLPRLVTVFVVADVVAIIIVLFLFLLFELGVVVGVAVVPLLRNQN